MQIKFDQKLFSPKYNFIELNIVDMVCWINSHQEKSKKNANKEVYCHFVPFPGHSGYDKIRKYIQAVNEYRQALDISVKNNLPDQVVGQIEFRLGWSVIRSKVNHQEGVEHLRKANELLPSNIEIMIKLAGVLFTDDGSYENVDKSKSLLAQVL